MESKKKTACSLLKKCGGCKYLDISYEQEGAKKTGLVREKLKGLGVVSECIMSRYPEHYRYKVTGILSHKKNEIFAGVYEKGTHNVLKPDNCIIEDEGASAIIRDTAKLLQDFKIKAYDEDNGFGLVRYLQVRVAENEKKQKRYMLTIVTASPIFPSKNNFAKAVVKLHPEVETIVQNINTRSDSMILAEREQILYGRGYVEDYLLGNTFRISSRSFYQVNGKQTAKLYQTAIDMLRLSGNERLLDAYCGTGTIGIIAASKAKEVVGVELNPEAVKDARINAKINNVKNITFYAGDAGRFLSGNKGRERFDAVIMDPPRSGSTPEFIKSLIEYAPEKIVYISCGIDALARDLKLFKGKYEIKRIQPVDMFPRTEHVETVVLLS